MRGPALGAGGRRVDLHAHTYFSDGTLSPEELVARAIERRLAALAVTDHDSLEALPRARAAAGTALELVPGIELSSALEGADLHILGYYVNPEHGPLRDRLERFQRDRRQRALAIVRKLDELGAPLDVEEIFRRAGPGVVGRPHVATALVDAGHAENMDDAFRRYLGIQGAAYVPRPAFSPHEAIALIHAADGISVLAHPGTHMADETVERLVAEGLRGIEVWHPQHGPGAQRRFQALAARHGLLVTGGSDFHTDGRGADLGAENVPIAVLGDLKEAAGVSG